jgi:TetR/AcrR family transcriptional regulator, transcriptional repressor for nem operon
MARQIEFDYGKAVAKATQLFWKHGYSNTSLRELLKAMDIGEGSFYNAVKSKKNLYLECLKHYNETVGARRLAALKSGDTVQKGVRAFFKTVLDELDDPKMPRVCLLAGSLSGDVLAERELKHYVVEEMNAFVDCFTERLATARKAGQLPKNFDGEVAAQVLVTYLQGLFRVVNVLHNRKQIEEQVEALLSGLGL